MLNDRQERFCKEYLIDCNASAAYIRAGYSPRGANALAARLIAKDSIHARITELMAEKDDALIAKGDEVLKTLTRILRREESEQVVITTSERIPTVNEKTERTVYTTRDVAQVVDILPKLSDVNRAAELLGKRYGLYTEHVIVTDERPIIVDDVKEGQEDANQPQ